MMKKLILVLLFTSVFSYGCNNEDPYYEPTLSPEHQKIIAEFQEIIRKNQLKADSISNTYNIEYNYTIPINVYLDRYSSFNYFLSDFERFITDVPYYGMCNSDTTDGFIYSLHFPKNKIDIRIYRGLNTYSAYGGWYKYNIKFK